MPAPIRNFDPLGAYRRRALPRRRFIDARRALALDPSTPPPSRTGRAPRDRSPVPGGTRLAPPEPGSTRAAPHP